MKLPFATRSINPGLPFVEFSSLIIAPELVSTSTRWLTATSVTKALLVTSEVAAQQVAFWSAILVDADTVAMLPAERESSKRTDISRVSCWCPARRFCTTSYLRYASILQWILCCGTFRPRFPGHW